MMRLFMLGLGLVLLSAGCTEIPPTLNPVTPVVDTSLLNQPRRVLIEEFTGVSCVNCPRGSQTIQDLRASYGSQVVAVNIHAGFFSTPYTDSRYDFRTASGTTLLDLVGQPLGYPTAVVNRKLFTGEERLQTGESSWPGFVAAEVLLSPLIALDLDLTYDERTRQLTATVQLLPQVDLTAADLHLSVFLTEDHLADYQLTPAGWQSDYDHRHVFRAVLSAVGGDPLAATTLAASEVSERSYTYTLPQNFVSDNCGVVAFVHRAGEDMEVLQAVEQDLR